APTTATAITLGQTTTIAANKNLVCASGTSQLDFSAGSGVFKTTTGAVTIGSGAIALTGDTTVTSGKYITGSNNSTTPPAITWTSCTFSNSWVNYDTSTYYGCGYYKDPLGFV